MLTSIPTVLLEAQTGYEILEALDSIVASEAQAWSELTEEESSAD